MALCPDCLALSPYRLLARPVHNPREEDGIDPLMYLLKPSFSSFLKSAESCQLCQLFLRYLELNYDLDNIQSAEKDGLPTPIQVSANSASGDIEEPDSRKDVARLSTLWVVCGDVPNRDEELEGMGGMGLVVAAEENDLAATSGDISGRVLADKGGSPASLQVAQNWLHTCLVSHKTCGNAGSIPSLPTRVIDVRPPDGSLNPRLFISDRIRGRYAALSHCWGKKQLITTTLSNISSHMRGMDFKNLPGTFQDAIQVTLQLGLRYLWIDSICIVQDDIYDWRREAGRMADVYANAAVTIAATAAHDSSEGLFLLRKEFKEAPVKIEYECRENRGCGKILGTGTMIISHRFNAYDAAAEDGIDRAPLNQRAWVFQERLLSRRTLHFAARQMYWECDGLFASEDGTVYDTNPERRLRQSFPVVKPDSTQDFPSTPNFGEDIIEGWCRILEEYTQRALTKDTDRLPALAGIVAGVLRRFDEQWILQKIGTLYLAGLWRSHLHIGLMWQAKGGGLHRPSYYRAPSWSWASLEGSIQYDTWMWSNKLPIKTDTRGEVKSGRLVARSVFKEAVYDPEVRFDMGIPANDSEEMMCGTLFCKETGKTIGWCAIDEACNQYKHEVCCFLISRSHPSDVVRQNRGLDGTENILVLAPRDGGNLDEFVRIGTGQIDRKINWYDIQEEQRSRHWAETKDWRRITIF